MTLLEALQVGACFSAALFSGASLYSNVVEHPARMRRWHTANIQWKNTATQSSGFKSPLAAIACICGLFAWAQGGQWAWAIGGLLIGSLIPIKYFVLGHTNRELLSPHLQPGSVIEKRLLEYWNFMHGLGSVVGVFVLLTFLLAALRII